MGIEVGYLMAYRTGGAISNTALIVNIIAVTLLIPIGLIFLKEKLSLSQVVGIVFALIGLFLIGNK